LEEEKTCTIPTETNELSGLNNEVLKLATENLKLLYQEKVKAQEISRKKTRQNMLNAIE